MVSKRDRGRDRAATAAQVGRPDARRSRPARPAKDVGRARSLDEDSNRPNAPQRPCARARPAARPAAPPQPPSSRQAAATAERRKPPPRRRRPAATPPRRSRPAARLQPALSRNIARSIEEGGKALAAYFGPRRKRRGSATRRRHRRLAATLGQVAEYYFPTRSGRSRRRRRSPRHFSICGRRRLRRLNGEPAAPIAAPDAERQALRRSGMARKSLSSTFSSRPM